MSNNSAGIEGDTTLQYDWIELYNKSSVTVDLSGWYITDKIDNLTKYDIPSGTTIDANDYLIIWADKDSMQQGLHCNFKLSASGETILLSNSSGSIIDSITFSSQQTNVSFFLRGSYNHIFL